MIEDKDSKTKFVFTWVSSSQGLNGFLPNDPDDKPTATILTKSSGFWEFKFKDIDGKGRIQVGSGIEYNPIDMIENIYEHLLENYGEKKRSNKVRTNEKTSFSKAFKGEWE